MPIKFENVGIAGRDLEETIAFFTDLGLSVLGRDTVSGEWADTAVGLDGNHAKIAVLQTPDGNSCLELFEYIHPHAIEMNPTRPNEIGMHRVAFSVDDLDEALEIAARHGCLPLRGVATYEDVYKLTYVRGPSPIIGTRAPPGVGLGWVGGAGGGGGGAGARPPGGGGAPGPGGGEAVRRSGRRDR